MKIAEKQVVDDSAGETEGARRATEVFPGGAHSAGAPDSGSADTEVTSRAQRRRFTAEYKRQIVREAERCTTSGAVGALLRREGLYSSSLASWRAARDRGELEGLAPKQRGPKAVAPDPRDKKISEQEREIDKWRKRADRAEALVEVQKKVAILLGTALDSEKP